MQQIAADRAMQIALQHHRAGRLADAIAGYRQAISLRPGYVEAHYNLGIALNDNRQFDEAIAAYRQAIALRPSYARAHCNLGNILKDQGQLEKAIAAFRQALAFDGNLPEAHMNLGNALKEKGRLNEAIAAHRRALALRPNYADALNSLGNALKDKGQLDEAIAAYRQSLAHNSNFPEALSNLGSALQDKGEIDEAIAALRGAIPLNPTLPQAYSNLGNALRDKGQLDEAITSYGHAIASNPNLAEVHSNLGNALKDMGQLDEAIAAYRRAIAANPQDAGIDSNLVYVLQFHPASDADAITEELGRWNRQHAACLSPPKSESLRNSILPHSNDVVSDRRLRIGYVSPDFRDHVVGRNLLPLFRHHDRSQLEITCYAQVPRPDAMTGQFQQHADGWRNIVGLSDEQVASQIRTDRIDVLVDLTLHMANNRLLIFARKPAPVQVTFAGYPGSTGLDTIDYRLSDPYLDPPGMDESLYSEKTIRLPDSFWCYDPLDCREIAVNPLPALETGVVTFGCLSNFCKVNDDLLALWAQVMRQVENSRLLLMAPPGRHRQRTVERLGQEGIDLGRIEFVGPQPRPQYLETYHQIDLGLDSFPYTGHTTSLDSFWMGVPVVTLVGRRVVSRAGWSQASNLGLRELAAQRPEQYVRLAVELAKDLPRLKELRSTLRQRMEQSPLMDAVRFALNIESAYRQMWRACREMSRPESDREE